MDKHKRTILHAIINNPIANGAFCGMIFNAAIAHPDNSIEELIDKALEVRVQAQKLVEQQQELNF